MEFKGTKGLKLSTYNRGRDVYFNVFKSTGTAKEHEANLCLLNKSEDMLEMLVELKRRIDIVQTEPNGLVRETMINNLDLGIDILIKQATEI